MSIFQVISAGVWATTTTQPARKTLVLDRDIGLRVDVERHASGAGLKIESGSSWLEAFVLPSSSSTRVSEASYVRLEPGADWHHNLDKPFDLLRCTYSSSFLKRGGFVSNPSLPAQASVFCAELPWKVMAQRLPENANARTAKLFRTPSKEFISTLLDAESGWELEEHAHATDVASICIAGGGTLTAGTDSWRREPLQVALVPADTSHAFVAGPEGVTLFILAFPAGTLRP